MSASCSPSVWGQEPWVLSLQGRGAGCVCPESVAPWPSCPRSYVQSGVSCCAGHAGHPPLLPAAPHRPRGPRAGLMGYARALVPGCAAKMSDPS